MIDTRVIPDNHWYISSSDCSSNWKMRWDIATDAFKDAMFPLTYHHEPKPKIPKPKKILYHGVATIVFWEDGTKTVVKRAANDPDNRYNAFCSALAIKLYGNNSRVNKYVKNGVTQK